MKLSKLCSCIESSTLQRIKEFNTSLGSIDKSNPFSSFLTVKIQVQDNENNNPFLQNPIKEDLLPKEQSIFHKILHERQEQHKETHKVVGGILTGDNNGRKGEGGLGQLQDPLLSEWISNYEEDLDNDEVEQGANTPVFTSQHLSPSSRRKDSFISELQVFSTGISPAPTALSTIIAPDYNTHSQMLFHSSPMFNNSIQQNNLNNQLVCKKTYCLEDKFNEGEEINRHSQQEEMISRRSQNQEQQEQRMLSQSQQHLEYISNTQVKMLKQKTTEEVITACSSERSSNQQSYQILQFQSAQELYYQPQKYSENLYQPKKYSENQNLKESLSLKQSQQYQQEQNEVRSEYDEFPTPLPATATTSWTMFMDSPFSFPQPELQKINSNSITSSSVLTNPQEASFKAILKYLHRLTRILSKINTTLNPQKYILNSQLSDCQKCITQCLSKLKDLSAQAFLRSLLQIILFQIFSKKFKLSSGEKQRDISWECHMNYQKGFSHLEDRYKDARQDLPKTNTSQEILSDLLIFANKIALPADYTQLIAFVKQISQFIRILAPVRLSSSITFINCNKLESQQDSLVAI